jgi:hypothetical protein
MAQKACVGVRNLTYRLKLTRRLCAACLGATLGLAGADGASAQNTVPPELGASKGKPSSGAITQLTPACRAAKQYIDLAIDGRFQEIGDLFADKADYVGPDAIARSNAADIKKVYVALGEVAIKAGKPHRPRLERLVPLNDNECFMEFDVFDYASAAYRLYAVDHFIVGPDGKVVWFRPYFQENSSHWHDDSITAAGR